MNLHCREEVKPQIHFTESKNTVRTELTESVASKCVPFKFPKIMHQERPNQFWVLFSLILNEHRGWNGREREVTTHLHLLPKLIINRAVLQYLVCLHGVQKQNFASFIEGLKINSSP
jgi:hypothetical protein